MSLPKVSFDKEKALEMIDRKTSPPPVAANNNKLDIIKNNKIERSVSSPVSVGDKVAPKPRRTSNSHLPKLI